MNSSDSDFTKAPSRGRPKGTTKKSKCFKGTPKKLPTIHDRESISMDISTMPGSKVNMSAPTGLVNIRNDCFFNSVVQALFS